MSAVVESYQYIKIRGPVRRVISIIRATTFVLAYNLNRFGYVSPFSGYYEWYLG